MRRPFIVLQIRSESYNSLRHAYSFLRTIVSHQVLRRSFLKLLSSRYFQSFKNFGQFQQLLNKVNSIDLSKQKPLDADQKAIQ